MEELRHQVEDAEKRALENYELASGTEGHHQQQVGHLGEALTPPWVTWGKLSPPTWVTWGKLPHPHPPPQQQVGHLGEAPPPLSLPVVSQGKVLEKSWNLVAERMWEPWYQHLLTLWAIFYKSNSKGTNFWILV